jgi:hypothetical protein
MDLIVVLTYLELIIGDVSIEISVTSYGLTFTPGDSAHVGALSIGVIEDALQRK